MLAVIAPPMTPNDWTWVIAVLLAAAIGQRLLDRLGPDCHPECREAFKSTHSAAKAKDHADFLRRLHETHDTEYPTKSCPHCDQRP